MRFYQTEKAQERDRRQQARRQRRSFDKYPYNSQPIDYSGSFNVIEDLDTYNFLVNDMTYLRMNNILSMALPKEDDAKRGELLIQRFDEIGMPGLEIEDKLVFYDVIRQYIKILQSYIECSRKYNIMQKPAVEELLRIVSLNNVAEELDEVQRTSGRMSHVSEVQREVKEALKYECIAKCVEGKYEEV